MCLQQTDVKNLNVQCNLIRDQSERTLDEYKSTKEREIEDLRSELEASIQAMRAKMKVSEPQRLCCRQCKWLQRAEEKYESIEASKEGAFSRMRHEMNETIDEQKRAYEKLVDDQIKCAPIRSARRTSEQHVAETRFKKRKSKTRRFSKWRQILRRASRN